MKTNLFFAQFLMLKRLLSSYFMGGGKVFTCLLITGMMIPGTLPAQQPFIELLDPQNLTLTQQESNKFNAFDPSDTTFTKQVIRLHPIENYLQGRFLTIQPPNSTTPITLTTDYGYSKINGEYYWVGYHEDGSHLKVGNYTTGFLGDLYIASTDTKYVFSGLSNDKTAMLTYPDWKELEDNMHCGNGSEPDDDPQSEEDEELEFRDGCENRLIRVLVLFTAGAAAGGLDPLVVGPNLIAELNSTTAASGLSPGDIRFALANTLLLPGFVERPNNHDDDIDDLADNLTAQGLRDANFADLVILLTANVYTDIAGVARAIRASNGKAYCLAEIRAVANNFTGSHEIGHVIGTRHQKCWLGCSNGCDLTPGSNHGFRIGANMRTIMHVNGCSGTRVGHWSSETVQFMGMDTGNNSNDNAKKLKKRAKKVSCFRTGVPIINEPPHPDLFYVEGPVRVCENQLSPFYKIVFNETAFPNPQFVWETSPNGLTSWTVPSGLINNGSECVLPALYTLPDLIFLRVTITGSNGHVDSDILMISKISPLEEECLNGQGGSSLTRSEEGDISNLDAIAPALEVANFYTDSPSEIAHLRIFPNPTKGNIVLKGLASNCQISVLDLNGKSVRNTSPENQDDYNLDIEDLPAGVYFLKVFQNSSIIIKKIIKQ